MADADALHRTPASRDLVSGYGPSRHDLSALRLGLSFTISHWQASGGAYHTEVFLSSMATFPEQKPENCKHISAPPGLYRGRWRLSFRHDCPKMTVTLRPQALGFP